MLEKPVANVLVGDHTLVFPPEPGVAVGCDDVVQGIANAAREEPRHTCQAIRPAEQFRDADCGI